MRETSGNSLERGMALLRAVIEDGGRSSVSALARQLQIPVPSAHRHISALVAAGFLIPGEYGRHLPGPELCSMAPMLDQRQIMARAAEPELARLASRAGTIAQLGVFENDMVTYLVKAGQSADALFTKVGMQLEAYCSGIGKVLLAHLPGPEQSHYLAAGPFVALTDRTITEPERLKAELDRIAEQGFASDDEEVVTGLQCLAVPVRSVAGEVVAAISTSRAARGDLVRWQQRMAPRLQAVADRIGSKIG